MINIPGIVPESLDKLPRTALPNGRSRQTLIQYIIQNESDPLFLFTNPRALEETTNNQGLHKAFKYLNDKEIDQYLTKMKEIKRRDLQALSESELQEYDCFLDDIAKLILGKTYPQSYSMMPYMMTYSYKYREDIKDRPPSNWYNFNLMFQKYQSLLYDKLRLEIQSLLREHANDILKDTP